jgi:uncharacterized protein (DUF305 family)
METKNSTLVITTLVLGLIVGYFIGSGTATDKTLTVSHHMPDGSTMSGTNMKDTMQGMTMSLEGKSGEALEKAFLSEMVVHHQGAVDMAKTLLKGTSRPELIKLGNDIINAQTQEIQMMREWQKKWFNH